MENKALESELRAEWQKWQANAHPEDRMPFTDYASSIGRFKGNRVTIEFDRWGDIEILFFPL